MAKRRKRRSVTRKAASGPSSSWKRRLAYLPKFVLTGFVPITLLVGAWIYWPREAPSLVPGLNLEAECVTAPEVKMTAQVTDTEVYRIGLNFGDLRQLSCTELKIIAPAELIDVIQLHDIKDLSHLSPESMRGARQPFRNFHFTRNALGQPVLDIPAAAMLGSEPFTLELVLRGIIQDTFEKFRLLIPNGVEIDRERRLPIKPHIALYSIAVPSRFDTLDVMPQAVSRKRQMGAEFLFFNAAELSEVDILFLDRMRDTWKTVFNVFAAAVAMSVLATTISRLTQGSR